MIRPDQVKNKALGGKEEEEKEPAKVRKPVGKRKPSK